MAASKKEVCVRPARREDIPAIVSISLNSVTDQEVAGFGTPVTESVFGNADMLSSSWIEPCRVGPQEILVAEIDGLVVGCARVEERGEELELVDIDVARELQGKGIGTKLVEHIEERAREGGRRAVTLGTSRSADGVPWKSLSWWLARGYLISHEEENEWTRSIGPGVREIRMRKNLR